nr:restriction endonuclease subunit S [Odoribacter splanchnicus]
METELQDIVPNICSGKDRISNSGEVALYGSTGVIGRTNSASYKENIVLVARVGANAGQMQIGNAPCGVTDNTLVIDAKEWNYYIYYFLQHYNLNRLVFGSGQPLITGGMLKRIKVRYGCKAERNNITRLLCLIDERIATQNKIIEKLQSLIKGIRNNMMIQNQGDYIALQDIADIYQPKTILSTDLTEDGYLVYGANGIIGKYHLYNHEKEQICITCRGNTCGTVNYTEPKSWITGNAMVINTDNFAENVNKRYLFHYLSSINFNSIISGSGQPQIVRQPLAKLKIILPELTIQEHIAKCLDTILAKIKNEQTSLQAIQIQKSYLLSQMFI